MYGELHDGSEFDILSSEDDYIELVSKYLVIIAACTKDPTGDTTLLKQLDVSLLKCGYKSKSCLPALVLPLFEKVHLIEVIWVNC